MEGFLLFLDSIYNSLLCLQGIIIPGVIQELMFPTLSTGIKGKLEYKKPKVRV